MTLVRHWWRQGATSVALGLTIWLSFGTLAITDGQTVQRIGLFPSVWLLIPAGLLGILAGCWRFTPHRWLLILPAALLALPWLPLPAALTFLLPASVFVWLGPVVTLVWATLAIAWLADTGHLRRWPSLIEQVMQHSVQHLVQHPGRAPMLAAGCALVLFLAGSLRLAPWLPGGDEPHYLVITQSLLYDGDLRIENNHRAQQYRQYLDRDLRPDYLRRGVDNQIYSVHAPGLPALILPAFAIGGYRGATIFLAIVAALGTALVWRVCWLVTGRVDAAWIGWAAMTGSVPVFFHAFAIYPDGVASVLVLSGVLALVRTSEVTSVRAGLHGVALALLPWLHTRFAILATSLGSLILVRLWQARARLATVAAFLATPVISAIAWFAFFYAIYGEFNPAAPYGSTMQGSWETLPNGVVGLLIDQQFGLLPNAPIFLIAVTGLLWMLRQRAHARLAIEMAIVTVPYAIATAAYPMWWGGWSAPARFLVPVVLLGSIPIALVWSEARTRTTRAVTGVALGLTFWLTLFVLSIHRGRIIYNDRDGYALWADWAGPVADLATGLPSLFRGAWPQALACGAIWAIAIGVAWLVLRRIESRQGQEKGQLFAPVFSTIIVPTVCGVSAMVALTVAWRMAGVSGLRQDVSQLQLVQRLREGSGAIDFGVPRLIPIAAVPDRLRLDTTVARRGSSPFRPLAQQVMSSGTATVFAVNDGIYLEPGGFWLEPGIDHTLLIVSATATATAAATAPLKLAVRNTPVDNRVTVTIDRWRRDVAPAPNEQVEVDVPAARSGRTLMRIRVAQGVRPADLDPRSSDHRLLGVWVELR
jgi:hypothetical protein